MSIKVDLENNLHEAMRNKNEITRDTLRVVLSSVKFAEIEIGRQLDDNGILSIIQKEVKIRRETINELKNTNRMDLIDKAQKELDILIHYLPAQLSDHEIEALAREVIESTSAKSMSDMGKVMGILVPKLTGQAAPERISQLVRNLLAQS
ncbi:MAG TPA: GatB/YqeY domain-containing protein [Anaerolineaceae bacterium]|nr:GatB/YqeY domain-containing protein [Anaerolineaceae bacterium]